MKALTQRLAEVRAEIDERLAVLTEPPDDHRAKTYRALNYTALAGGKRVRPLLFYCACEVCGGDPRRFIDVACAIELVHTASLVLDDLPAMDDASLRRGRPTVHTVYDEAAAILAAVGGLMQAFELIAACGAIRGRRGLSAKLSLELSRAVGRDGMIAGQQLDLDATGSRLGMEELEFIHAAKTGVLFIATARMGALCAGARDFELEALEAYAKNLGLAFQIADDLLDVTASAEELGKDVGKDVAKPTFAHLFGLEASRAVAHELVETSQAALGLLRRDTTVLSQLAAFVLERRR
ncbi:MAG: geranyl transferase [Candidatus Coatesbacteria bacterium]|nr:geranyl transferase [Candidatus Coatesbacteria bacterium]